MTHRRALLAALVGAPVFLAAAAARAARMKRVTKAMAEYQDKPKNFQSCGTCTYFIAPHRCKAVFGSVESKGWCMLFEMSD